MGNEGSSPQIIITSKNPNRSRSPSNISTQNTISFSSRPQSTTNSNRKVISFDQNSKLPQDSDTISISSKANSSKSASSNSTKFTESEIAELKKSTAQLIKVLLELKGRAIDVGSVIHKTITCDVCNQSGLYCHRYKCSVCKDYDLCSDCYFDKKVSKNHTIAHPMILIDTPLTSE